LCQNSRRAAESRFRPAGPARRQRRRDRPGRLSPRLRR